MNNQVTCSKHSSNPLTFVLFNSKRKGLYCIDCVKQQQLPQQSLIKLTEFIQHFRKEYNGSQELYDLKKMQNDFEKKLMNLLVNIKQRFVQCQDLISQQLKFYEAQATDNSSIISILDQLEEAKISERQAQDLVNQLLFRVNQNSPDFRLISQEQGAQNLKERMSRSLIFMDQQLPKLQQQVGEVSQSIFNILNQLQQQASNPSSNASSAILKEQPLITSQPIQQATYSQTIFNKTPVQPLELKRSQTPNQSSATPSKTPETTNRHPSIERSTTDRQNQYRSDAPQQQKSYQFQSGRIFEDQQSKSPRLQQNQAKLNNSSLVSRSTIFPKFEKIFAVKAHDKRVSSVQVGPLCVFTCSYDRIIRTWEKETGKLISTLEGHTKEILAMKYKYDSLATGGVDRVIRIWRHHPRWQLIANLKGHADHVTCLDFLNPKQLISGSEDRSIRVWDAEKQVELHQIRFEQGIHSLVINGDKLFAGGEGVLLIFQCPQLQQIRSIQLHEAPILFIVVSRVYLITICREGVVKLLDLQQYTIAREIRDDYEISSALYISSLNILALGLSTQNGEGKMCFWSLDTHRKVKEIYDNGSGVGGMAWEQPYLWSGHDNKRLESIKLSLVG